MYCVYFLRSIEHPKKTYVGMTDDVNARLRKHNSGGSPHTAKWRPWELVGYIAVRSKERAAALERYVKQGSGYAWSHKHMW